MDVCFCDGDRAEDLRLMAEHGRAADPEEADRLRRHVWTGRPCASRSFVETAERLLGRRLRPRPAGRPSKTRKLVSCARNTPGYPPMSFLPTCRERYRWWSLKNRIPPWKTPGT